MTLPRPPIVLASASPRRRELLRGLGLSFEICPADLDETPEAREAPGALAERLSRAKAEAVARQRPEALVIAADTVVTLRGRLLGKPADEAENRAFLAALAGREHEVLTGHALAYQGRLEQVLRRTVVRFRPLSAAEIAAYAASGEGRDKAGGYAIQGLGATLVPYIEGCYFNVVGLSITALLEGAARLGVRLV